MENEKIEQFVEEHTIGDFLIQDVGQYENQSINDQTFDPFGNPQEKPKKLKVLPVKSDSRRKSTAKKSGVKKGRKSTDSNSNNNSAIGEVIRLYAYKACLGKNDSLLKNEIMPLWYRDGSILLQKYLRQKFENGQLFYYSTNCYSCWEDERSDEFLEIECVVTHKQNGNIIAKILDLESVEKICVSEDFKNLGLAPYMNYQMRATEEMSENVAELEAEYLEEAINTSEDVVMMDGESSTFRQ